MPFILHGEINRLRILRVRLLAFGPHPEGALGRGPEGKRRNRARGASDRRSHVTAERGRRACCSATVSPTSS